MTVTRLNPPPPGVAVSFVSSASDRHACVTSALSKVLLTVSRMSAGALLPSMACCILSKCYATRYFLHHSWLALVVSFEPAHELHTCEILILLSWRALVVSFESAHDLHTCDRY